LGHEHFVWFSVFMSKKTEVGRGEEWHPCRSKDRFQPNGDD